MMASTRLPAVLVSVVLVVCGGCASYRLGPADAAQALDSATTAMALYGTSAVESNALLAPIVGEPIGMVAVALFKQGLVVGAKALPLTECKLLTGVLSGFGLAAGINNLLVLGGAASPGAAVVIPAAFVFWWLHDRLGLGSWECQK